MKQEKRRDSYEVWIGDEQFVCEFFYPPTKEEKPKLKGKDWARVASHCHARIGKAPRDKPWQWDSKDAANFIRSSLRVASPRGMTGRDDAWVREYET